MCGIAGSFSRVEAFKLYESNLVRGRYSAGLLTISKDRYIDVVKSFAPFILGDIPSAKEIYLLHSRAPTSRTTEYRPEDTHPFEVNGVYVAHNGIITNADSLGFKYDVDFSLPGSSCVDSYIIPYLISHHKENGCATWCDAIVKTLEEIKGTFGLWIYIAEEHAVYICRCGSTLYADYTMGSFSSSPQEGFALIPEGILFAVSKPAGIFSVKPFKTQSTYYFA